MYIFYPILAVAGLLLFIQGPTMKPIMDYFAVTEAIGGLLPIAFFSGNGVGVAVFPRLALRVGSLGAFRLSLGLAFIGSVAAAVAPNIAVLIGAAAVFGIGVGVMVSLPTALLSQVYGEKSSRHINRYYAVFGAGILIGPPLAGYLQDAGYGWRPVYLAPPALILITLLLSRKVKLPDLTPGETTGLASVKAAYRASPRLLVGMTMLIFFYLSGESSINYWSAVYLGETFAGSSGMLAGSAVTTFWVGIMLGRFLCSLLLEKISRSALLTILSIGMIVGSAGLRVAPTPAIALLVCFGAGLFFSGVWPTVIGYSEKFPPNLTGAATSIALFGGGFGGAIGPYIIGRLAGAYGYRIAMLAVSIFPLIILITIIIIRPEKIVINAKPQVAPEPSAG